MKLKNLHLMFFAAGIVGCAFLLSSFKNKSAAETKPSAPPSGAGQMIPKIPTTPDDPVLENGGVYPMWGPVCQRYTYHTTYRDKEGRPPEYVRLYFNGEWIEAQKEDPRANDFKKGVRYTYQFVPHKLGSNFFFFEASNGQGKTREGIIDSPGNGPVLFEGDFKHNEIALIDTGTGQKLWRYPTDAAWVSGVALSDNGQYLAALTAKEILLFEKSSNQPVWRYSTGGSQDTPGDVKGGIAISGDGSHIFASMGNQAFLFDNKSEKPIWKASTNSNGAYSAAISKDGQYMAVGTAGEESNQNSNLILLWNAKSSKPLWQYHASGNFHEVSLSDGGSFIAGATGCPDRRAYIFSKGSNTPLLRSEMLTRDSPVDEAQISSDGSTVAFGLESDSGGVVLFGKDSTQPLWRFSSPNNSSVRALAVTSDGETIAAGTFGGKIFLFDKESNQPTTSWAIPGSVGALDISSDGETIAAGGADNKIHLYTKGTAAQKSEISFEEYVGELDLSADGKYAAAGTSGSVYFFETFSPNENKTFSCDTVIEPPPLSEALKASNSPQFAGAEPLQKARFKMALFFEKIINSFKKLLGIGAKTSETMPAGGDNLPEEEQDGEKREENLPADEQGVCGNTMCEPAKGETRENCPKDCTPSE